MSDHALSGLVDAVDTLLDVGVAVVGNVVIGVADVDLVSADLRLLLTGMQGHIDRGGRVPAHRGSHALPPREVPALPRRLDADADRGDAGLGRLIVVVAELLHRIVESQALARLDGGSLSPPEQERLGRALHAMDARLAQLRAVLAQPIDRPKELF